MQYSSKNSNNEANYNDQKIAWAAISRLFMFEVLTTELLRCYIGFQFTSRLNGNKMLKYN